jgi:hypothetical protein
MIKKLQKMGQRPMLLQPPETPDNFAETPDISPETPEILVKKIEKKRMMIQCSIKLLEHAFSRIMIKRPKMSMMGELKFLIGFESINSRYACSYVKAIRSSQLKSWFFQLVSQGHAQEV